MIVTTMFKQSHDKAYHRLWSVSYDT